MFGVSGTELIAITVIALILVGPERLPEYAQRFGRFIRSMRQQWDQVRTQTKEGLDKELQQTGLSETKDQINTIVSDVHYAGKPR